MCKYHEQIFKLQIFFLAIISILACPVSAGSLEWSLTESVKMAQPGDTIVFSGTISNQTGQTLESTDLFFDFLLFDFNYLLPNQELGAIPFTLLDLTNSGEVVLFNVVTDSNIAPNTYYLSVLLQDVNNNIGNLLDITIVISQISQISEPNTISLLLCGLVILFTMVNQNQLMRKVSIK